MLLSSLFAVILVILTGFSVNEAQSADPFKQDINVKPFHSVAISVPAEVFLEQASENSVNIEAEEDLIEKISIQVENGKLIIKPEVYGADLSGDIRIYITSPDYESVTLSGSGKVYAHDEISSEEIILKISGSGSMEFDELKNEEAELKIAGSGRIMLKGNGEEMEVSIAGSGNLEAFDFEVEEFNGKISGSGECNVFVKKELDVSIAGSGKIIYLGNPEVNSSVAGSGKVEKRK